MNFVDQFLKSIFFFSTKRKHPGRYTFQEALENINIKQTGTAHSAIDDAKTLAKMVSNLYQSGAKFSEVTDWRNNYSL